MAQDWRDQRNRPDDRFRQVDPRSRGREGGDYGSYRGQQQGGRDQDDGYLDRGYQGGGWGGQSAGSVSESSWHAPEDDFRNDYGTGAYDVNRDEPRYGGSRGQPGFPSFGGGSSGEGRGYAGAGGGAGRGVPSSGGRGYNTSGGAGYGGYGQSDVGGYGAAYRGERVNMDQRGGLEGGGMERGGGLAGGGRGFAGGYVEPGYATGDFRGQQGAFHEERGYGNRRDDQGWWGGPTGERPSWQRMGDQGGHQGQGPHGEHRGRGPRGYRRSDQRIHDDVNDRLTDDPMLDASEIDVEVKDGEVTLTGTVDSRQAKRHAEDLVESISGVVHCQNNLRIRSADRQSWTESSGGMGRSGGTGQSMNGSSSGMGGTTGETGAGTRSAGMQAGGVPAGTSGSSGSAATGQPGQSGTPSGTASVTGSNTGATGGTTNRQH